MLVALDKLTNERIESLSFQSGLYIRKKFKDSLICPFCNETVFPRDRSNYILHFVHKGKCHSSLGYHPESIKHILGKKFIQESLKSQFCDFDVQILLEFPLPEAGRNGRIADVVVIFPAGFMIIYECQLASIFPEEIKQRSEDYKYIGGQVKWLLGNTANTKDNRNWCHENLGASYSILFKVDDNNLLLNIDNLKDFILVVSSYIKTDEKPMLVIRGDLTETLNFPYQKTCFTHFFPTHLVVRVLEIWNSLTTEKLRNGLGAKTEKSKHIIGGAIGALNSQGIIKKNLGKWEINHDNLFKLELEPLSEIAILKSKQRAIQFKNNKTNPLVANLKNTS